MHNLEQFGDTTAFVSYREPGWHNLGTVVDDKLTAEEAIKSAELDWTVELHPIQSTVFTDSGIEVVNVPDKFAVVRKHPLKDNRDALGVVGNRYTPIQNREVFRFLDALTDGGATYETAGSMDGGRKVFMTMKMPSSILIDGKDKSDMYLFATTSHDGSFSLNVSLTAVRVVCYNTWRMARRASEFKHTIRHTANSNKSIVKAREVMSMTFEYAGWLQEQADKLAEIPVFAHDAIDFVDELFPYPKDITQNMHKLDLREQTVKHNIDEKRKTLKDLYLFSPGQQHVQGNAWGLFNAVTEYADYYSNTRAKVGLKAVRRAERQVIGEADTLKDRALDLLLQ
jgi:phage/plasmid-like protein (TIGR03299 family)